MITKQWMATLWPKLKPVLASSLHGVLLPVFNLTVSLAIIRLYSVDLWGDFVSWLIVAQLVAHVANWGNRDYLLRIFSRDATVIADAWHSVLRTRALLLLAAVAVIPFFGSSLSKSSLIMLWATLLFLQQSFDVFIPYHRAFLYAFGLELLGVSITLATVMTWPSPLTVAQLVVLFCLVSLLKTVGLWRRFRTDIAPAVNRLELAYLRRALPFFMLGFSGMLQARIDLYTVTGFLTDDKIAQYQTFTNWLIYIRTVANFIVQPFIKDLYSIPYTMLLKMARRLLLVGCVLVPFAIWVVHWVFVHLYLFDLPPLIWPLGVLYILPIYFYIILIFAVYKSDNEIWVIGFNLGFAAINLLLNLALVPSLGILGATASTVVVQWGMAAGYWLFVRRQQLGAPEKEISVHA